MSRTTATVGAFVRTRWIVSLVALLSCSRFEAGAAGPAPLPPETALINQAIAQAWEDQGVRPSEPAQDGPWCRRVYLDVIGRIPSYEELSKFLADRSADKRQKLVDRLLGEEYLTEYARHETTLWTNLLIGRTGGANNNSMASRPGMQQYLRRSFQRNKPVDVMMHELITAVGSCRPGDEDFNGAANFLADKLAENGVQATARTAQIFLGVAVQCTQCHNHPFNEAKQNQFWELNAFFRQARAERLPDGQNDRGVARIMDRDFAGEGGDPSKADVFYELRNGRLKVAYPVFMDRVSLAEIYADRGEDFGDRGYLADVNRRAELAKLIRESSDFPQAIVNRVWGRFLGAGFTKPVDDLGPHNPPTHPELLEMLAMRLRDSSFDLKALTRWIVLSDPYGLDSRATRSNESDDPSRGARPQFSRFYLRQIEAEQLYESLLVATGADQSLGDAEREAVKQQWLEQFNTALGNDENGEATSFNGSIPQALALMNGDLMKRATGDTPDGVPWRVAYDARLVGPKKVEKLYLAALARRPDRTELAACTQILAARQGNTTQALQDIWWALLNSNEFILNH